MKKIIVVLLAAVLVVGGLGGVAYAQINSSHLPMTGQKLVGTSEFGTDQYSEDERLTMQASFTFTNPDCVSEITIERISIIRGDGTLIYEGPLLQQRREEGEIVESTPVTWPMKPHELWGIGLQDYMPDPDDPDHEWKAIDEALFQPLATYTVEIFWSCSDQKGLPLIGTICTKKRTIEFDKVMESAYAIQMVNMEQVLQPKEGVTILRLQTWLGPNDPLIQPLRNFAEAVKQRSDYSVRIDLYPGDGLVPFGELVEAVEQGTVEMGLLHTVQLREYSRVMDAGELPFLYNDNDGLMAAVRGGIGELLSQELTAHNITALDWTTWGFFHLFSKDMMLDHPDDVVGRNIRAYGMQAEAISAWGGNPVWMPPEEIYSALDTGELDGVTHSLHICYAYALFEVAPYFCVNYAFGNLEALCINSDVWNSLDKKTRNIITKAAGDYVNEMMATVKQLDAEALQQIQQPLELPVPVEVYTLTPEQRLVWRDASQAVWDGWVADVGSVGQQIKDIALEHNPLP